MISTIAIVAPSSQVPAGLIDQSVAYFEKMGFRVKLGKHLDKSELFSAGSDEQRAEDLIDAFQDPEVEVILTARSGCSSIRTLRLLDYDIIRQQRLEGEQGTVEEMGQNPKPIVGFSDTTALQLGIYAVTGMQCITGFNCRDIKDGMVAENTWSSLLKCLNRENYSIDAGESVFPGKTTGPLVGGNLTCMLNLMGSQYQPDFSWKILLIEDVGVEPYLIEDMFSQLYVAGILDQVAGIIIGRFTECTAKRFESKSTTEEVIKYFCNRIKVPCIADFPYGHIDGRCALPLGQVVTLDASSCRLEVNFAS